MKKSLCFLAIATILSISYTPAIAEDYYFRAKAATIGMNGSAEGINVESPIILETTTNTLYSITKQPSATGGITPYVWSVTGDSELGINSSTGELSGKPTTSGLKTVNIVATDSQGKKGTTTVQVQVYDVLNISGPTFDSLNIGKAINVTKQPSASGGNLIYTWSLSEGPSWLTINSANGHLAGTPTTSGTFSFKLTVNDTANHSYSKTFSGNVVEVPKINIVDNGITTFTVGDSYNQQFSIVANPAGVTYATGNIPEGTSLNANDSSATVSGTLSQTGNYTYQVNTTNASGTGISSDINVNVYEKLLLSNFIIDNAVVGDSYNVVVNPVATGGDGNYTYSIDSQTTGANLTINSTTGVLSGTPTTAGNKTVVVRVVDASGREKTVSNNVTVYGQLVLNNPVFGNSMALSPVVMTSQPSASGGNGNYTWSLSGNPSWMTINASTGVISGTPDTVGDFTTQVVITSGTQTKTSSVISGTVQTPTLTLATLTLTDKYTTDIISQDFKSLLTTTGVYDENAVVWSATNLPTGLTVNSSNGVVSGTVSTTGNYNFNIMATFTVNGVGYSANQNYSLKITSSNIVVSMGGGGYYTCALMGYGGVKCWGNNSYGQLGNGTTVSSSLPVDVQGLTSGVSNISVGYGHACAVTTTNDLKCWGWNITGQLGNGTTTNSSIPVTITSLIGSTTKVSAGIYHTCAITTSGTAKCWGDNGQGALGNGTKTSATTPVSVSGITNVSSIETANGFTCAVSNGSAKCWGTNIDGELGNGGGGTNSLSTTPTQVSGLTYGVLAISSGDFHTCALLSTGSVKCWGWNNYGDIGNGTLSSANAPVQVTGLTSGATGISLGGYSSCAMLSNGNAKCWGLNTYGQLGDGTTTNKTSPVNVIGVTNITNMVSGYYNVLVKTTTGSLKGWGLNGSGQLGDGTTTNSSTPVDLTILN